MQQPAVEIEKPGDLRRLKMVNIAIPTPKPDEVVIENRFAGVAFADVMMREGLYPGVPRRHVVPGYDVVGTVTAVGAEVRNLKPGDAVVAMTQTGGYARYSAAKAALVAPKPANVPDTAAVALVLNYVTAWQMLARVARVQPGDSVLVHGPLGGAGSALCQLATHLGCKVYGTVSERKADKLAQANFIPVRYQQEPFEDLIRRREPTGVDVVFDAIGGTHLKRSLAVARPGGNVVTYGFSTSIQQGRRQLAHAAGEWLSALVSPVSLLQQSRSLRGYNIWVLAQARPEWFQEDLQALFELYQAEKITPLIADVLPLQEARRAQEMLQSAEILGKVVLDCRAR